MSLPCEITTQFYYMCGHTVHMRRCRRPSRLWRDGVHHDEATACDDQCRTRNLPIATHQSLSCPFCSTNPAGVFALPGTVRSDPDVEGPLEDWIIETRRSHYGDQRRAVLTDAARAEFYRLNGKRNLWEVHRRLETEFQDREGVTWQQRQFFMGHGADEHLLVPIRREAYPADDEQECGVCRSSMWDGEGDPIMLPCHPGHYFHANCIEPWLKEQSTCPNCRARFNIRTYEAWCDDYDERPWVNFFFADRPNPFVPERVEFDPDVDIPQEALDWAEE